ncbi:hypothetical protein HC928_11295 [bacterium]|nr:hypothetical protein [bacterium]
MPGYTRGISLSQLRFVKAVKNAVVLYGWNTKDFASIVTGVTAADITVLGHKTVAQLGGNPGVLRANKPKPARVTRVFNPNAGPDIQKGVSTFCDADQLTAALAAKWKLAKPAAGVSGGSSRMRLTAVEVGTVLYAFTLNAIDLTTYAADIGAKTNLTDTDFNRMVTGASIPKPAVMGRVLASGGTFSTFVDKSKIDTLRAAGWTLLQPAIQPL